jgi:prophage regulatory protein
MRVTTSTGRSPKTANRAAARSNRPSIPRDAGTETLREAKRTTEAARILRQAEETLREAKRITEAARIERLPEVLERTGIKKTSLYAKIGRKEFPAPIPLGPHSVGWLSSEITAWIAQCAAARQRG